MEYEHVEGAELVFFFVVVFKIAPVKTLEVCHWPTTPPNSRTTIGDRTQKRGRTRK